MKIPFKCFPAAWGLRGDAYAEAEAHYLLSGEALDRKLMEIRYKLEPDILKKKLLDIDLRYLKIDQYQYDIKINEILYEHDVDGKEIAQIDIDLRHKKISEYDADVKKAKLLHDEGLPLKMALIMLDVEFHKITEYESEIAKAKLLYKDNSKEYRLAVIDAKLKHDKISEYDADIAKLNIRYPGEDKSASPLSAYKFALLEMEHNHGKMSKKEFNKQVATLKNEPWVDFIDSEFDSEKGVDGFYFELDWNPQFIDFLKIHGFVGHTDEQVVEDWFDVLCQSQGKENYIPPNASVYPMGFDGTI